ncbi:EthD domain-containing protein [Podospora didyma]|uniref:EthD domain-containing protein n=1 Tax=Podospora didyma TaxID=330526 RepID=A0AAE0U0J6_9PEZI|nr:EthD domain-containing protein [Podospora didyma]
MLCLTMCAYRKEGMDHEDYRNYMTKVHAPLVLGLMIKYGIDKYTMSHNSPQARSLMALIAGPQFSNVADYDCIVQIQFRDVDQFVALKSDPEYKKIFHDHEKFADTTRSKMTIGWVQDFLRDGEIIRPC